MDFIIRVDKVKNWFRRNHADWHSLLIHTTRRFLSATRGATFRDPTQKFCKQRKGNGAAESWAYYCSSLFSFFKLVAGKGDIVLCPSAKCFGFKAREPELQMRALWGGWYLWAPRVAFQLFSTSWRILTFPSDPGWETFPDGWRAPVFIPGAKGGREFRDKMVLGGMPIALIRKIVRLSKERTPLLSVRRCICSLNCLIASDYKLAGLTHWLLRR